MIKFNNRLWCRLDIRWHQVMNQYFSCMCGQLNVYSSKIIYFIRFSHIVHKDCYFITFLTLKKLKDHQISRKYFIQLYWVKDNTCTCTCARVHTHTHNRDGKEWTKYMEQTIYIIINKSCKWSIYNYSEQNRLKCSIQFYIIN